VTRVEYSEVLPRANLLQPDMVMGALAYSLVARLAELEVRTWNNSLVLTNSLLVRSGLMGPFRPIPLFDLVCGSDWTPI
jgi:hypothetical protein